VVDRLVVGDAGADGVGERDGAGAVGAHQPGHAEHGVRAELERVDEVVVEAAVDGVHALQAMRRAHVEDVVAHDEVGCLDELDAHLAREERVLRVHSAAGRIRGTRSSGIGRSSVGPSSPVVSNVIPCCTKIASRRRPAAASCSGPSASRPAASAAACGRGVPSLSNSSS